MTLGEKIKKTRTQKKMTQSTLCGDKITRNMLSAIECGKAAPSLDTLYYIAKRLSVPISYLISEDDELFFYSKRAAMKSITYALREKRYKSVIEQINTLGETDDELSLILANAYFELGKRAVLSGSIVSGTHYLESALQSCERTVYDTEKIKHSALIYSALARNIKAPLLELDVKRFESNIATEFDYDLYKYLSLDATHHYKNPVFIKHIKAKEQMKERKYKEALTMLNEIEEEKTPESYNAYVIFGVYTDIENCYKQLADFENAYRYASKRLSLIEGFKT